MNRFSWKLVGSLLRIDMIRIKIRIESNFMVFVGFFYSVNSRNRLMFTWKMWRLTLRMHWLNILRYIWIRVNEYQYWKIIEWMHMKSIGLELDHKENKVSCCTVFLFRTCDDWRHVLPYMQYSKENHLFQIVFSEFIRTNSAKRMKFNSLLSLRNVNLSYGFCFCL